MSWTITDLSTFSNCDSYISLQSNISITANILSLTFKITGELHEMVFDKKTDSPSRTTGLWNKTCFELFLRSKSSADQYIEFNYSPSGDWDCFFFQAYGDELKRLKNIAPPRIDIVQKEQEFQIYIEQDISSVRDKINLDGGLEISQTCVTQVRESFLYWAKVHLDQTPNFHHPESFYNLK